MDKNIIDSLTYELSILEEIPQKPYKLPQITPHLLQKIHKERKGEYVQTTIDKNLQNQVDYENGADIFLNEFIEAQLVYGIGYSYGRGKRIAL